MFETEFHRWLQTFNAPVIEYIMRGITFFGQEEFYALLMLGVIFGVDRKKGFLLTQILLWVSLTTAFLKHAIALPRPVDVDTLVKDITGERNVPSPFVAHGAGGFFDLLPPDVVAYFRALPHIDYGFPSGHCSSSVATWGSAAILFRRTWLIWATAGMFVLMPLSRIYLGRHFLADVLGGLVLGLLFILVAILIERNAGKEGAPEWQTWLSIFIKFVLPAVCIIAYPPVASEAAMLLGVNLGQLLTTRMLPAPVSRSISMRLIAVLIAALAFFGTAVGLALLATALHPAHSTLLSTVVRVLAPCIAIVLATKAGTVIARRTQTN
jgi:membrane-associated phospholipid phosphatase